MVYKTKYYFSESITKYFEQWGPVESVVLKKNKDDPTKHR